VVRKELYSFLHHKKAVKVNITIIRSFVKLRQIIFNHKELSCKLEELERKISKHAKNIQDIFEAIRQLMEPPEKPKHRIGFYRD
jgi:uncharacterized membrane protein